MRNGPGARAVQVCRDTDDLAQEAAREITRLAATAIAARGQFTWALSGGSTPVPVYELLGGTFAHRIDWARVHVFWGDERCVPPHDPLSNYRLARETFLDRVALPQENIHRIAGESDPELAAREYEQQLRDCLYRLRPDTQAGGGLDLILLGMGSNGHTASLFPEHSAVREQVRWVVPEYISEMAAWRITLTPVFLNMANDVLFLVSGADKAETLRRVLEDRFQPETLPAQIISPANGRLRWFVDKTAATHLSHSD